MMKQLHGGNIREISQRYGIPEEEILDFSASINPLGISKSVFRAILDEMGRLVRYPEIDSYSLREILAGENPLRLENVLVGNGSTEFIYLIPKALRPKRALIPVPSFSDYERSLLLERGDVRFYPLRREDSFLLETDRFLEEIRDGIDLVWLCNPNNPTGGLIPRDEIRTILKATEPLGIPVVVDEAFMEFIPVESVRGWVREFGNLLVLRSFTKFFAIPGLRAGALYGSEALIRRIASCQEPWSVNRFAQSVVTAVLCDKDYQEESRLLVGQERLFLERELNKTPGIHVFPSCANFLLIETSPPMPEPERLFDVLLRSGILVRNCESFRNLDSRFFRVAVRDHEENLLLIQTIRGSARKFV